MTGFLQDLRFGLRMFFRSRAVTAVALILLAVGIGANTAIFSLINAILLRPLPGVQEPERLVRLLRVENGQTSSLGYPDYVDYRDRSRFFSGVIAECPAPLSFTNGTTERIRGAVVSGNYFSVLGVRAAAGRLLTAEDDRAIGAAWVAVISHAFWQKAFGSDPSAVGKNIRLNGHDYAIVGIASEEFRGTSLGAATDVWLPIMMQPAAIPRLTGDILTDRTAGWLAVYGRMKPGVRTEQAGAEVSAIANHLAQLYPKTNEGHGAAVAGGAGLYPSDRENLRNFFSLLFAAVAMLLLISCCNVANLFLTRAWQRRREISVRLAVGASRGRLVRQLLTESVALSCAGSGLGLLVAFWGLDVLFRWLPASERVLKQPPPLDVTVLTFAMLLSIATGILFGLAPALLATKADVATTLKDAAPASGFQRSLLARTLVIAQVSLSLVLLIGAGLIIKSMGRILSANQGFDANRVLIASLDLSVLNYSEDRSRIVFDQLAERLRSLAGVRSVSLAKSYPASGRSDARSIFYEGQEPSEDELRRRSDLGIRVETNTISPDYFRTLQIPLLAGRDFGPKDAAGATPVCIVSQRLATRLWPRQSPLGKRIAAPPYRGPRRPPLEIIGVVADVKYRSLIADQRPVLYLPLLQNNEVFLSIITRTAADPNSLAPAVAREVAAVDRDLPLYQVQTLSDQIRSMLWEQREAAGLIGLFGVFALLVASVGLYSVVAQAVAQRTREIGIRVALGAHRGDVLRLIVRNGMALAVIGTVLGSMGALALMRLLSAFLYGVSATDGATFVSIALLLFVVSLAACYVPARAASRMDPVRALRHE